MTDPEIHKGLAGVVVDGPVRDSDALTRTQFPVWCRGRYAGRLLKRGPGPVAVAGAPASVAMPSAARTLKEIEMEHVLRVLEKHGGSKTAAAEELRISLKTMYNKLNTLQEERKSAG